MPEQSIEFRYDTQLLLDLTGVDEDDVEDIADEIRDHIMDTFKGDELLCVPGDEVIKLHYHTNEPWLVLEYCRSHGEIYDIVVEDMDRQTRGLQG